MVQRNINLKIRIKKAIQSYGISFLKTWFLVNK
jgi:hypothetical protein